MEKNTGLLNFLDMEREAIHILQTRMDCYGRLIIRDVSMLQTKNYIDFIGGKENNKYRYGRVINENRACSLVCK